MGTEFSGTLEPLNSVSVASCIDLSRFINMRCQYMLFSEMGGIEYKE